MKITTQHFGPPLLHRKKTLTSCACLHLLQVSPIIPCSFIPVFSVCLLPVRLVSSSLPACCFCRSPVCSIHWFVFIEVFNFLSAQTRSQPAVLYLSDTASNIDRFMYHGQNIVSCCIIVGYTKLIIG